MYKIAEHILYEDDKLLVCIKPAGIAVQTKRMGEQDMESLLRNYLAAKGETPFIGIIHRLDQPVEGVMVFGKTKEATAELNRQMQKNGFGKYYLTVVYGKEEPKEGQLIDFLKKDGRSNTSSVVKQGTADAKRAALTYRVLECSTLDDSDDRDGRDGKAASGAGTADGTSEKTEAAEEISLLEVKLETGRHEADATGTLFLSAGISASHKQKEDAVSDNTGRSGISFIFRFIIHKKVRDATY